MATSGAGQTSRCSGRQRLVVLLEPNAVENSENSASTGFTCL